MTGILDEGAREYLGIGACRVIGHPRGGEWNDLPEDEELDALTVGVAPRVG